MVPQMILMVALVEIYWHGALMLNVLQLRICAPNV